MSSSNNVCLPIGIGFTLESFVDMAKSLCSIVHTSVINIEQAGAIISILCPKKW